ncbi:hypothetical protein GGX14DRAFT_407452 [Mycena pura]|uniref:Uncharacterized protein n=1 Tax=Mycena pura TaxID=153505 RepID=A0AAD6UN33_9AGAR|nr:hypothetical protein GGX14DRAFT_407452 [Mycena pura]
MYRRPASRSSSQRPQERRIHDQYDEPVGFDSQPRGLATGHSRSTSRTMRYDDDDYNYSPGGFSDEDYESDGRDAAQGRHRARDDYHDHQRMNTNRRPQRTLPSNSPGLEYSNDDPGYETENEQGYERQHHGRQRQYIGLGYGPPPSLFLTVKFRRETRTLSGTHLRTPSLRRQSTSRPPEMHRPSSRLNTSRAEPAESEIERMRREMEQLRMRNEYLEARVEGDGLENHPRSRSRASRAPSTAPLVRARRQKLTARTQIPEEEVVPHHFTKDKRLHFQRDTTKAFRRICNILGKNWPEDYSVERRNLTTNEEYPSPLFSVDGHDVAVNHPHNKRVLALIADQIHQELLDYPPAQAPGTTWDLSDCLAWTKESYRAVRKDWMKFHSEENAKRTTEQQVQNRHDLRVGRKSVNLLKVVDAYAAKNNLDPQILKLIVHEEFLSDEHSEPEEGSGLTKEEWVLKLAINAHLEDTSPAALCRKHFFEVSRPEWRSDEGMKAEYDQSHEGSGLGGSREPHQRVRMDRTSTYIPRKTPFNFMINQEWLAARQTDEAFSHQLEGWGNFEDPDGFGGSL